MQFRFGYFFLFLIFGAAQSLKAQVAITGKVADAKTAEPLASAHVIIKGTYKGTITNEDGEYRIVVSDLPSVLEVRFLGYESLEKKVEPGHSGPLDFLLKESVSEMGEITVTGEDPAISIMKEVIRRKQIWRARLNTYSAEAYTRQQLKNDTSIVSISESVSEVFWDRKRGNREVLKSRRQTANIEAADNFAGVSYLPNFYDDNLDIAGFDMVGVTHPNALSYYHYELTDINSLDNEVVYEIKVSSKRKLQPLFEGTIYVLGEEYALLSVDLKPNSVVAFPAPVQDFDLTYSQQFSSFGGDFWLPVDVRIQGLIEVGLIGLRFPPIGFKQVSKLNDYKVNIALPDTLFKNNDLFSVNSTTINSGDSLFVTAVDVVPLSQEEETAYESLDSTATLEKAFRPTGFFTRFIDWEEEEGGGSVTVGSSDNSGGSNQSAGTGSGNNQKGPSAFRKLTKNLKPDLRFNRVDELYGALKHERRYLNRRLGSELFLGYSTGYAEPSYGGQLAWWPKGYNRRLAFFGGYRAQTKTRYNSDLYPLLLTSIPVALGYSDYFDYFRREGVYAGGALRMRRPVRGTLNAEYKYEEHSSITHSSSYDLAGSDFVQRPNSYADEGTLSSLTLKYERGDDSYKAFGAVEANRFMFEIEHSGSMLGSSWDFTRFKVDIYKRFNTFYKRRFFPNTLDIRLNAGTYLGDLPVQENEALDAALGGFTPFGAFRAKRFVPYEGASYVALNAEHNFKSVPLELLGWRDATKTGLSVIAFGGIGKTWVKDEQAQNFRTFYGFDPSSPDDWHMEAGVSLSNIFNLFRADVAYRLDSPGLYFGVSVARLF